MKILFFLAALAFEATTILSLQQSLFPLGQLTGGHLTSGCSSPSHSAVRITIHNNCDHPVWVASVPGGGKRLNQGDVWIFDAGIMAKGRIWARTNCIFNFSGIGRCQTGDCGGLLQCQSYGTPPNTVAEFALNSFNNLDFFDISLTEGFNVPMQIKSSGDCGESPSCAANITSECPIELRAPGGCNSACTVFNTDEYCCRSSTCGPTDYSRFFKKKCPNAYSYPSDDQTATFTCPSGTSYQVVFCP